MLQKKACNTLNPMRLFHQLQPTSPMQAIETRQNIFQQTTTYKLQPTAPMQAIETEKAVEFVHRDFVATYLANAGD